MFYSDLFSTRMHNRTGGRQTLITLSICFGKSINVSTITPDRDIARAAIQKMFDRRW
jgi:hypothetical protein